MLDDCKGPKFEDMLAALSTSVLQKVLANDQTDTSAAKKLALDSPDSHLYFRSLLPLTISYRATLKEQLREKKELNLRYHRFGRLLDTKKDEISQRTHNFDETTKLWKAKTIPRRTVDKLKKHVEVNWYGDKAWVDILTKSDRYPMTNTLIERPFDQVWPHVTNDTVHKIRPDNKESLLETLEKRVAAQNERLDRWRKFQESLTEENDTGSMEGVTALGNLGPSPPATGHGITETPRRTLARSDHAVRLSSCRGHSRTSSLRTTENSLPASDARPLYGRCVNEPESLSKSPTKRVHSQIHHTRRHSSRQVNTPSSSADRNLSFIRPETAGNFSTDSEETGLVSSLRKMSVAEEMHDKSEVLGSEILQSSLPALNQASVLVASTNISSVSTRPQMSPQKLSLAERTRMSMAMMSPVKTTYTADQAPSLSASPTRETAEDDTEYFSHPTVDLHPMETLLDRTRQSMSLMSTKPQGRRPSHRLRSSAVHPTNQSDSPRKNMSSYEEDNTSILEEILPDLDVDYETVFKSRPKIALSPRLKPMAVEVLNIDEALDEGASIEDFS